MLSFKPVLGCEAPDPFGAEDPAAWALRPQALPCPANCSAMGVEAALLDKVSGSACGLCRKPCASTQGNCMLKHPKTPTWLRGLRIEHFLHLAALPIIQLFPK